LHERGRLRRLRVRFLVPERGPIGHYRGERGLHGAAVKCGLFVETMTGEQRADDRIVTAFDAEDGEAVAPARPCAPLPLAA
jgi:hypothetical protein